MEAFAHLLVVARQGPRGGNDEEDLEDVQHAKLGGHEKHTIAHCEQASQESYLP